jgi:hypothetical protein
MAVEEVACAMGCGVGGPVAPTTYLEDVDGGTLGGDAEGPAAPTTYLEDVNGGTLRRRCQRSESAHHLS